MNHSDLGTAQLSGLTVNHSDTVWQQRQIHYCSRVLGMSTGTIGTVLRIDLGTVAQVAGGK